MNCPYDDTTLEPVFGMGDTRYRCQECHGQLTAPALSRISHPDFSKGNMAKNVRTGEVYRCPRDNDLMFDFDGEMYCQTCRNVWIPGEKHISSSKESVASIMVQAVGLAVVGVGLFAWQLGSFSASADTTLLQSTAVSPLKIIVILLWFVTFSLIFLLPATVYHQMVLAHRPHIQKTLHNPLVRWLPIIVIALMGINIYFLTP